MGKPPLAPYPPEPRDDDPPPELEALRGARMPWNDVLENAPLFAATIGIEIVD